MINQERRYFETRKEADEHNKKLNNILNKLLVEFPLYRKMEIPQDLVDVWSWTERSINTTCKIDNTKQTFILSIPKEFREYYGKLSADRICLPQLQEDENGKLNYAIHIQGKCSFCNSYRLDYLINIFTTNGKKYYARKIGAYPPFEIKAEKNILNYLSEEHQEHYKKALMNFSTGYGIGAFAYLRRIVEETIRNIVQDVISLKLIGHEKVEEALIKYNKTHSMSALLDEISDYLPIVFSSVGDNPLKLIYNVASLGIHQLSEEECLEKAHYIDVLLKFIIKQINEEKGQLREVRNVIKQLKK